jgi:hypothetical protein
VGYNFAPQTLRKLGLTSLSIALRGSNLVTWSNLKEMDPESLRGYPIQRTYGINLNFGL